MPDKSGLTEEMPQYLRKAFVCPMCGGRASIGIDLFVSKEPSAEFPALVAEFVAECGECIYEYANDSFISLDPAAWEGEVDCADALVPEIVNHCVGQAESPNWMTALERMGFVRWNPEGEEEVAS